MNASINRRTFIQSAAGAAAIPGPRAGAADRPNILIVMTDQQFAEAISCRIGRRYIHTPHMDSLAATGVLFTRAYAANPLCVPSRTSMFTGRYPAETLVQHNDTSGIDAGRFPMMGSIFKAAGYTTAYFGKWHLPFPERSGAVHGFDLVHRTKNRSDVETASAAAAFLRDNRKTPYLAVASFRNPHDICQWARSEPLPEGEVGSPPTLDRCPPARSNRARQNPEPDGVTLARRSYQSSPKFPVANFDEKKWREYIWAYYRMIEKVDRHVGEVLAALAGSGREEQTVVVFLADHGDCQGAHQFNQKSVFYDESCRVPLIVSHKGVTKRASDNRLVNTGIDLIPTLCDYAGIRTPGGLPGLSVRNTASGGGVGDPRRYIVVSNRMQEGAPVDGRLPKVEGRMVRSQRYKYCYYPEGRLRESFVDMERDPGEMVNLARDPSFSGLLASHRRMLAEFQQQTGDRLKGPA